MQPTFIERPSRWDLPFGAEQTDAIVATLLGIEPFAAMAANAFPVNLPLRGILRNDCRLMHYEDGDVIIRQGDYGNSAFMLLEGEAAVSLRTLPEKLLAPSRRRRTGPLAGLLEMLGGGRVPERRDYSVDSGNQVSRVAPSGNTSRTRVFVQDLPRVMDLDQIERLGPGELFGELSALTRTPRSATVIARGSVQALEIRWQGLRDLMRYDDGLKAHVERAYRQHSLQSHLRETPLLRSLPKDALAAVAAATEFETFGNFEWQHKFQNLSGEDIARRILSEPVVVERGDYVNGLLLIRNGFARVCRKYDSGYRTVAYLGKGAHFGWREVAQAWRTKQAVPWQLSLRAVGYLDVLRIPSRVVEQQILPHVPVRELPAPLPTDGDDTGSAIERRQEIRPRTVETGMLEFLVEQRFINGAHAMLIDLNRCTRCDDCVRACAATHDGNPRFVRDGAQHEQYLVANACMHCADPVCMIGCPTGAIRRNTAEGVIAIDDLTCIGCSTCAKSCPYHNIRMVEVRDRAGNPYIDRERNLPIVKATKCDLCVDRSGGPACQRACPHDALVRIDLTTAEQIKSFIET
jgi:Fe-S-cluster-containing dehydrogenase component/CRP-like cAMP-binding protein